MSIFDHIYLLFAGFDTLSIQSQWHLGLIVFMVVCAFTMSIYNFIREVRSWRHKRHDPSYSIADCKAARFRSYPGR